jgi:SAM-dependent methyltransferase
MMTEAQSAAAFYATPRGELATWLLRERLLELWPPETLRGQAVLGFGYVAPYLNLWQDVATRCIALSPAQVGVARWPMRAANLSCTGEEDSLPFPDLSFDRVIMVHGLEAAENATRLLREMWRVLKDDGRLLVVAANRRGLWAHMEGTPFGQGEPYSPVQIGRLLADSMFRVERKDTALYVPPTTWRVVLKSARLWESGGRALMPGTAGVTMSEAVKDVYAAIPAPAIPALGVLPRRRMVLVKAA